MVKLKEIFQYSLSSFLASLNDYTLELGHYQAPPATQTQWHAPHNTPSIHHGEKYYLPRKSFQKLVPGNVKCSSSFSFGDVHFGALPFF